MYRTQSDNDNKRRAFFVRSEIRLERIRNIFESVNYNNKKIMSTKNRERLCVQFKLFHWCNQGESFS